MVARPPVMIVVDRMTLDDLDAVRDIERESFSTPWPTHAYRSELEKNRLAHYFVARHQDQVIGYAGLWMMVDEAHITTFAVRRPWRRHGVGERLLVALLDLASSRGAIEATLEVRPSNIPARRLYEKFGFRHMGLRTRYYSDNNEDALIMTTDPLDGLTMRQLIATRRAELAQMPEIEVGEDGRPVGWSDVPDHTDASAGPQPRWPRSSNTTGASTASRPLPPGRVTRRDV
jgi:ribosomal-protein-alanine N-acetyltransferase